MQASAQLLQVGQPGCRIPRLPIARLPTAQLLSALPTNQCLPPQCEANLSIAPPFFPPLARGFDAQHGSNPSTVLSAQALPPSCKSMTPSQQLHKRKRDVIEKRDGPGHEKSATDIVLSTSQSVKKSRQQRTFSYWLPNELSELERYCAQRPGCSMRGLARGIHVSLGRTFSSVESKIKQMRKGK